MSRQHEAVIRMHAYDPCILTTDEFEQLEHEVNIRIITGTTGISDRICARLIREHKWRYVEAKAINEQTE